MQRGFRSVVVYLTALDSSRDFLAVGSSIGMLYLYCRRLTHMNKYSLEVRALLLWCCGVFTGAPGLVVNSAVTVYSKLLLDVNILSERFDLKFTVCNHNSVFTLWASRGHL